VKSRYILYLRICPAPVFARLLHSLISHLVRDANNTTSRPSTRIARLQAILVPALPKIIRASVNDDRAAQHALLSDQLDKAVLDAALPVAVAVGLEVAKVADVAGLVAGGAVRLAEGVEVRAGGGAAVGVVACGHEI
jgi:hypothetical protein